MPRPSSEAPLRLPPMCSRCLVKRAAWTRPRGRRLLRLPGRRPVHPAALQQLRCHRRLLQPGPVRPLPPPQPRTPRLLQGLPRLGRLPQVQLDLLVVPDLAQALPRGHLPLLGRTSWIGESGACRLCHEQARLLQEPGKPIDLAEANKHGQQLFFANLVYQRIPSPRPEPTPAWRKRLRNYLPYPPDTGFTDHAWVQDPLLDTQPDPKAVQARARIQDDDLTRFCAAIVNNHATRYGWSVRQRNSVIHSLRVLQTLRPTPNAKVRASEVIGLRHYGGTTTSTIEVLSEAGLLIEDIPTNLEVFLANKTSDLPPLMVEHLTLWVHLLLGGSRYAPRQSPRDASTVKNYLRAVAPFVRTWANAGHQSFAEITRQDVIHGLATIPTRPSRSLAYLGLKAMFSTLKARKLIFVNPIRGIPAAPTQTNIPLELDTAPIQRELNSPNPAVALAVALIGFHALTNKQLRGLRLTDIADGRLTIGDRNIPLAAPVRSRLAAWLNYRNHTWPATANPYLLINRKTAPRIMPVGATYPWTHSALRPQLLREDRILHEIHATGGDVRRISDLFGLTIAGTTRYLNTVEHPDLTIAGDRAH